MSFQPYRCLHVPVEALSPLARLLSSWPWWLAAVAVVGVAVHEWGPWVLFVPVGVVIVAGAAVLAGDFTAARRAGLVPAGAGTTTAPALPALVTLADRLDVTVRPADGGEFYVCIRCQQRPAVTVVTVRALPIPVCTPCLAPALAQIEQAAARAVGWSR